MQTQCCLDIKTGYGILALLRKALLDKQPAIQSIDLICKVTILDHQKHCFCNFFRITQSSNRYFFSSISFFLWSEIWDLLFASASTFPGRILVFWIKAGATPFTVIPLLLYVCESQWINPCRADLAELKSLLGKASISKECTLTRSVGQQHHRYKLRH